DTSSTGIPDGMRLEDVFPGFSVDLGLRTRYPSNKLEKIQKDVIFRVDEYCMKYEERIRKMGGIGFFFEGLGPDGHIGFNVSGSDFYSTTRLTPINYETAAAAAPDLGGIENSRGRLVITIGLSTITFNENATIIITAAGESSAGIVKKTIQSCPGIKYPGTALHRIRNARFYLTSGAASELTERNYLDLSNIREPDERTIQKYMVQLSKNTGKPVSNLTDADCKNNRFMSKIIEACGQTSRALKDNVSASLKEKIQKGIEGVSNSRILHTSPHHDDEILGYFPFILHLVRKPENIHHFSYMTSGYSSVSDSYIKKQAGKTLEILKSSRFDNLFEEDYFNPKNKRARDDDIYYFLDAVASFDEYRLLEADARRLVRSASEICGVRNKEKIVEFLKTCREAITREFPDDNPVMRDLMTLKGRIREWEAELAWGYLGFGTDSVTHCRLKFYSGGIFRKDVDKQRDVEPVLNLLDKFKPDIVTVALDPEGSGPDTHYKVMQIVAMALKKYSSEYNRNDIKIWGYRNVWYRFQPFEADIFVPVSLNSLATLNNTFLNCFGSQKEASIPSPLYDGPFSGLASKIMTEQYELVQTCLGSSFFYENPHPRIRATHALAFIREMNLDEFYDYSINLRNRVEP
ncbi:MAG: glucosamine-6-phosphate deaminase, partial [Fibrobacterota bacterium]